MLFLDRGAVFRQFLVIWKKVQPFLCHAGQHCHCVQPGFNLSTEFWCGMWHNFGFRFWLYLISRWWFQVFFMFISIWWRWTHFDEHIFQMGWFNHQLDTIKVFSHQFLSSFLLQIGMNVYTSSSTVLGSCGALHSLHMWQTTMNFGSGWLELSCKSQPASVVFDVYCLMIPLQ